MASKMRRAYKSNRFSSPSELVKLYNNAMLDLQTIKEASNQESYIDQYVKEAKAIYNANNKSMRSGKEAILIHAGSSVDHVERIGCWLFSFSPFLINGNEVGFIANSHSRDRNGKESIPVYCFASYMPLDRIAIKEKWACGLVKTVLRRVYK